MKLQPGEQLLYQDRNARHIKGKLNAAPGSLILTNQRLAFEQRSLIPSAFGLLGLLILGPLFPGKVTVSFSPTQIASFSRSKIGINQNVIQLKAADGTDYTFAVSKFDKWAPYLTQAGIRLLAGVPA